MGVVIGMVIPNHEPVGHTFFAPSREINLKPAKRGEGRMGSRKDAKTQRGLFRGRVTPPRNGEVAAKPTEGPLSAHTNRRTFLPDQPDPSVSLRLPPPRSGEELLTSPSP